METKRLPLASFFDPRDAALTKDGLLSNCYEEKDTSGTRIVKRPGYTLKISIAASPSRGITLFGLGNYLVAGSNFYDMVGTQRALTGASSNGPVSFTTIPSQGSTTAKLIIQDTLGMWVFDGSTVTRVTDGDYPVTTVPGVVYLNGTVYVMDADGVIRGSDLLDPFSWSALNFISAKSEGGQAIALARHLSYILAFRSEATEIFYDAGNPVGSPLAPMLSAYMKIGCASAGSIASNGNTTFFVGQTKSDGRAVYRMDGFKASVISTPFVDRILRSTSLALTHAYVMKQNGHEFYFLNLPSAGLSLVYDLGEDRWSRWTHELLGATDFPATTVTVDGLVTATTPVAHNLSDGDPILIQAEIVPVTVLSATTFSFTPALAIPTNTTYKSYTELPFPGVFYSRGLVEEDLLLDKDTAKVYSMNVNVYQDIGSPINTRSRTSLSDWGVMREKFFKRLELVGDVFSSQVLVRYTDDDYQTWSQFEPILVTDDRAQIGPLGSGRRRAHEFRHLANTPLRMEALEVDFFVGAR